MCSFYILAWCAGCSVSPFPITHVHPPLISQYPPTPSICATYLASFPLCYSPLQSCDYYCVVPATQKLAWPNLNQSYWSCSCFISQHKGCTPHFRGSTNEWLIGGVLCRQCFLHALTVSSPVRWCSKFPSLLAAAGCFESRGRKRGERNSAVIAACRTNKAQHSHVQHTGEKVSWGRVSFFRKGRCWW